MEVRCYSDYGYGRVGTRVGVDGDTSLVSFISRLSIDIVSSVAISTCSDIAIRT